MHPYATDSNERKRIPLILAGLSVIFAWILNKILSYCSVSVPWWIDTPSVFGFYGVLYSATDKWLWRWQIFRKVALFKVPDLIGQWSGYVSSSFDDHATRNDVQVTISQTWTRIGITLYTETSQSYSLIGSVLIGQQGEPVLTYEYINEPKPEAPNTMHTHRGMARLLVREAGKVLEGEYYSGRDRQNYGILHLERNTTEIRENAR